jgi:flagellar biosynthesis protein FlhB
MSEKTEAPTPRRRDEARAKGQGIGRSHEFSMGLTLGVGTLALSSLLPGIASSLVSRTQAAILTMDPRASDSRLLWRCWCSSPAWPATWFPAAWSSRTGPSDST